MVMGGFGACLRCFGGVVASGCGGVRGRVLFSESPRGRQRRAGYRGRPNPLKLRPKLVARQGAGNWLGAVERDADRGNADLQSSLKAGKFEKLLRSDPERWFGWCRVCLLFENSIVCQVC